MFSIKCVRDIWDKRLASLVIGMPFAAIYGNNWQQKHVFLGEYYVLRDGLKKKYISLKPHVLHAAAR